MAGLPADYARAEWHKLGEAGLQVRPGIYLTRAGLRHAVARRVEWFRQSRTNHAAPNGRIDRDALKAELENLRSEGDPATLTRRKEITQILGVA
jgi:hypothetical protein